MHDRNDASGSPYAINYDDPQFQKVESDKNAAISETEKLYSGMAEDTQKYYQAQVDASKDWEKKQTELQNQQTDFALDKIQQQKDQAQKDYTREQSGAYVDWQKQSNRYGASAEAQAAQGMGNSGYSESAQVGMFNAYQNRVSAARESYNLAVQNYNNAMTEARLQNSSVLAEIAYKTLQTQLELSLQGFQYKNQLLMEQANKKLQLEEMYHNRWLSVLDQMNKENSLAEQIRQFNASMAEQQRQFNFYNELGEFAPVEGSGGGGDDGGDDYDYGGWSVPTIDKPYTHNDMVSAVEDKRNSLIAGGADASYADDVAILQAGKWYQENGEHW